jgi:hypothetical protein
MPVSTFDEHERPGCDLHAPAIYQGAAASRNDLQPLIGAPVPVIRAALCIARDQHHLCSLCAPVPEYDPKAFSEA